MNRREAFAIYDQDFFAWTQAQGAALRELPAHVTSRGIDVAHVAEEIEDLGKRELREVKSLLSRLLEHLIKLAHDRNGPASAHWRTEALVFQRDAFNGFSLAMRQYLDVADLWRQGRRFAAASLDRAEGSLAVPLVCPFDLDDLVGDTFVVDPLIDRLKA